MAANLLEHAGLVNHGIKNTVVPFNGCVITIENNGSFQLMRVQLIGYVLMAVI